MSADEIEVDGKRFKVRYTSQQRRRCMTFTMAEGAYSAIEQNPETPSRWGELAHSEHQVVRFKSETTNKFVAVAVDGEVEEY